MKTIRCMAAASALLLSACASAQDMERPATPAEWREAKESWSPNRPRWRDSPASVTAPGARELFADAVFVSDMGNPGDPLSVRFYGRDGRFLSCGRGKDADAHALNDWSWRPVVMATRTGAAPVLHAYDGAGKDGYRSVIYDGTTGEAMTFMLWRGYWWEMDEGHLQTRLPAAVWTACPDFPTAAELGMEVNRAQTALRYPELLAQDPGRRILRPDLVDPDAFRHYER